MGFSNCKDVALTIEKIMKTLLVFKMSLFCNFLLPKKQATKLFKHNENVIINKILIKLKTQSKLKK